MNKEIKSIRFFFFFQLQGKKIKELQQNKTQILMNVSNCRQSAEELNERLSSETSLSNIILADDQQPKNEKKKKYNPRKKVSPISQTKDTRFCVFSKV